MTRLAKINQHQRQQKLQQQFSERRKKWKQIAFDPSKSEAERNRALARLTETRRASSVRSESRCAATGRPRGVWRRFGLCRNMIRKLVMNGEVPGVRKASW